MTKLEVAMVANDLLPTPDWLVPQLAEQGIALVERQCTQASEVLETAAHADVVWLMGGSRVITPELLPQLPRCRMILRTGTGTDNVPVDQATAHGIIVANTPEVTTHHVAEHALGLLFAVIRQIARQDRLVPRGGLGPLPGLAGMASPRPDHGPCGIRPHRPPAGEEGLGPRTERDRVRRGRVRRGDGRAGG